MEVGETRAGVGRIARGRDLCPRVTPRDAVRARVVAGALRPRRDILQAERRPERPGDRLRRALVSTVARERQEVRGRREE